MLGVIHLLFLHKPQLNKRIIKDARSTVACWCKKKKKKALNDEHKKEACKQKLKA